MGTSRIVPGPQSFKERSEMFEICIEIIRVNFSLNAAFEGVVIIQMTDRFECSFKYSNFDSLDAFSFRRTFFSIRRNN